VNPRSDLDYVEKRKFLTLPGLELRLLGRPARSQSLYRLLCPGSCMAIYQNKFKAYVDHISIKLYDISLKDRYLKDSTYVLVCTQSHIYICSEMTYIHICAHSIIILINDLIRQNFLVICVTS
jgi:hypothetical protein